MIDFWFYLNWIAKLRDALHYSYLNPFSVNVYYVTNTIFRLLQRKTSFNSGKKTFFEYLFHIVKEVETKLN